jgi:hypothetical protein
MPGRLGLAGAQYDREEVTLDLLFVGRNLASASGGIFYSDVNAWHISGFVH